MPVNGKWQTTAAYVGAFLLATLLVVPSFGAFVQMKAAARSRQMTYGVLLHANALETALINAETGQRGYVVTGDEAFLEPYAAVQDQVRGQLSELRQMTLNGASQKHLDALGPLMDAKLADMASIIASRRAQDLSTAQAAVGSGNGKRLMDAIRIELAGFTQIEEATLARIDESFQSRMNRLLAIIVVVSLFTLLVALTIVKTVQRESRQRLKDQVHQETRRLLELQERTNGNLHLVNATLQVSEENLRVTLDSIGDAVIATDAEARIRLMNPVAERLTGWSLAEASGQHVDEVFQILNQETRLPSTTPIMATLEHGTIQGLANHTLLIARDGSECAIADSCAPIRDREGLITGAVLVFRDVTDDYAVQQALRDSNAMIQTVLGTAVDGIITFNAINGLIKTMNPAAERMFGYPASDLIGQNLNQLIPEFDENPAAGSLDFLRASGETQVDGPRREAMGQHRDGHYFPLEMTTSDMTLGGRRYYTCILRDITERKQAEAALIQAGALQQAIFQNANFSSIATDAKGVIQIFNVGAERMLGYSAAEVVDKVTPADVSDPQEVIERAKALSLELGSTITPGFEALVFKASRGIEDIYELTYIRKDGSRFPAVVSVTALRDDQSAIIGYLLIGTDNTARKQAEADLIQAGALQKAIFQSVNFSSIATDAKGVIQIFNVGAEEMLGYSAVEVVNKVTPADLSDPQEVIERAEALSLELATPISPGFDALAFKAFRGIEDIYELTLVRKDGTRFPAVVSVTALRDPSNSVIGYLLIATDNGARKRVEEERALLDQALQGKNAELELAISVADKANQAKSEFLSSMSHELRSPLNAILGFAQLMDSATPPATPSQKASIDRILHAGWYLLELINEILDLAVIESGKLSLSEEPVSLAEVLADCQSMLEPQAVKRGLTLTFPTFEGPVFVRADRIRLKQVLVNLLSNALKYNRPGGSVVVDCTQAAQERVRISVRDTGQGLTPEQLRQLFQPFNRLGQEHSAEEGTGIGLVMSKLLVELMGGTLGVSSTPGAGSVFWYDLNASAAPVLMEPKTDTAALQVVEPVMRPCRTVLYVEDNPANLALIEQLVARRPDLLLLSATDAMAGLQIARDRLPDVILMDINLPGISGHQALKILLETPTIAHIPVLAISANAMVGDIQKGLAAGFFRYLTKPIVVSEFMAALDEGLDAAQQHRSVNV